VNDHPIDTNTRQATTPAALSYNYLAAVSIHRWSALRLHRGCQSVPLTERVQTHIYIIYTHIYIYTMYITWLLSPPIGGACSLLIVAANERVNTHTYIYTKIYIYTMYITWLLPPPIGGACSLLIVAANERVNTHRYIYTKNTSILCTLPGCCLDPAAAPF